MPVKITKRLKALAFTEKAKPLFFRFVNGYIKDQIRSFIEKGISPVNMKDAKIKNTGGKNRYEKYSDSYIKGMGKGKYLKQKKQSPRNLKVDGKLLNSLKTRLTTKKLAIWFSDGKAKYHNDLGAGKSKVIRRILPRDGESWARAIDKEIVKSLSKAIKKTTK